MYSIKLHCNEYKTTFVWNCIFFITFFHFRYMIFVFDSVCRNHNYYYYFFIENFKLNLVFQLKFLCLQRKFNLLFRNSIQIYDSLIFVKFHIFSFLFFFLIVNHKNQKGEMLWLYCLRIIKFYLKFPIFYE